MSVKRQIVAVRPRREEHAEAGANPRACLVFLWCRKGWLDCGSVLGKQESKGGRISVC